MSSANSNFIGVPDDEIDSDSDDENYSNRDQRNIPYSLAGVIPPELIFGNNGDGEGMMNAMVSDEILEELK